MPEPSKDEGGTAGGDERTKGRRTRRGVARQDTGDSIELNAMAAAAAAAKSEGEKK